MSLSYEPNVHRDSERGHPQPPHPRHSTQDHGDAGLGLWENAQVRVLSHDDSGRSSLGKINKRKSDVLRGPNSCMRDCLNCAFRSRLLVSKNDREAFIRTTLCELAIYILYLIVTCISAYGAVSTNSFYYTNVISRLFLEAPFNGSVGVSTTFLTSTSRMDFWKYAKGPMLHALYWENQDFIDKNEKEKENRLVKMPYLRQLRVKDKDCSEFVSRKFHKFVDNKTCFPTYSRKFEDSNFGKSENDLKGTTHSHWGKLGTYSGAGDIQELGINSSTEALELLLTLENATWIRRATRAVFLDFTMYNANVNLFCIVELYWEFPATGGVVTSASIRTVKLDRYVTAYDDFILAMEIIFILFTVYYTLQEVFEMFIASCSDYGGDFWAVLDWTILILSYLCIGFGAHRAHLQNSEIDLILDEGNPNKLNFYYLGFWETQYNNAVGVLVFLVWIKCLKYISFNETMAQLSSTMSRCTKDVGGFAIMFFIVFFAFAQLGYLLFGSEVEDFRTFHDTVYALLRLILGDFDFLAIERANRVLGPLFFISYVFFVFFVLINMFLAIINDTYSQVKAEVKAHGQEFEITDYMKRGMNHLLGRCGCGSKRVDIDGQVKLANTENVITNQELRRNLKLSDYTEVEIEMFLARYELDEVRQIDIDEAEHLLGNLEGYHPVAGRVMDHRPVGETRIESQLAQEEMSDLQTRIGTVEGSLTDVTRKIDELIAKLNIT